MNDGMLSQDEIDALLNVSADEDTSKDTGNSETTQEYLSDIEIDTIGELGNISFGSSATTLSMLLNQKVEITTPSISMIDKKSIAKEFTFEPVSIQVDYTKGFTGRNVFVIKANDASIIADIMLGGDGTNPDEILNEISLSAVQEAMNQMMGAAATSLSTVFNKKVDISPPSIIEGSIGKETQEIFDEDVYVRVSFRLIVGDLIDSDMMQLIPLTFAKQLVDELLNDSSEIEVSTEETVSKNETAEAISTVEKTTQSMDDTAVPDSGQHAPVEREQRLYPPEEREDMNQTQYLGNHFDGENTTIEQASFSSLEPASLPTKRQRNLDMLMDISLKVTVELGRTKKTIKEILDLSSGSIVELDKLAGEPVDILVNGKLIAEGEVVVIEENFGVRLTDIISQSDRLMNLK